MRSYILILLLVFPFATQAEELTIDTVVSRVLHNHPAVQSAQWATKSAKARRGAEAWLPDPKIGVEFDEIPRSKGGLRNAKMTSWSVSQEIPFPGTLATRAGSANAEYKATQALEQGTKREMTFEAKKTFYELIATQNLLKNKEASLSAISPMMTSAEENYKTNGNSTGTGMGQPAKGIPLEDILSLRMKRAEIETEVHDLLHQENSLRVTLNLMMGQRTEAPLPPLLTPPMKMLTTDDETLKGKLIKQNSQIEASRWMEQKAGKESALAALNLVPSIEPEFAYQQRENEENSFRVGVQMNIPLWLNRNKAEIDAARAAHFQARSEKQNEILKAQSEFYYLLYHARHHFQIAGNYEHDILPLAQSAFNISLTAFETGTTALNDVMTKFINLQEANTMYWDMWKDYQTEYALLEQMIGEKL